MLVLDHEQCYLMYEGNFEGNFADKMNLMYTCHIIYVLMGALFFGGLFVDLYAWHSWPLCSGGS